MIGIILLTLAAMILLYSIYIGYSTGDKNSTSSIASQIASSPNLELLVHELFIMLLTIGFVFAIDEIGGPFWQEAFPTYLDRILPFVFPAIIVLIINFTRHGRFGLGVLNTLKGDFVILETMVDSETKPKEGIHLALLWIEKHHDDYPQDMAEKFLRYLSERDDETGKIARERLNDCE